MEGTSTMSSQDIEREMLNKTLTRREVVAASAAATAAVGLGGRAAMAQATPRAGRGNVVQVLDETALMDLSTRLVGGADLEKKGLAGLVELLSAEPDIAATLDELNGLADITPEAIAETSPEAQRTAGNILQYWYLGQYDGEPIPNRSAFFFNLASWQVLPYSTLPTVCKGFGYWAEEIQL